MNKSNSSPRAGAISAMSSKTTVASTAGNIHLQKFGIVPEDDENHVFTFVFENPQKLLDVKSIESSEVNYGGQRWSLVCMRKDDRFMGIFLKWKYGDGQSAASISSRTKYSICLVHRHDYTCNKYFNSSQKFTNSQSLLGKSKFIPLSDLLDYATGYLDETGKRVILELSLSRSSTRFEKAVDISPKSRTRKNASGYYFDTNNFVFANHRWYLRIYPTKLNSNGLPAAYLYLSSKPRGINLDLQFRLYIGQDSTESLSYNFGEGAKFDGFGKTLPHPLYNLDRVPELIVGVEIETVLISKDILVNLRATPQNTFAPHLYNSEFGSYNRYTSPRGYKNSAAQAAQNPLATTEAFQDQEGNYWKVDLKRDVTQRVTLVFDKGVHHFPQNKTKLVAFAATLLSRDPTVARDIEMNGDPLVGYFSNFIDEKGYIITFPVDLSELDDKNSLHTTDNGEVVLRLTILSLQTAPMGMRSVPIFDYQSKHLLRTRKVCEKTDLELKDLKREQRMIEQYPIATSKSWSHDLNKMASHSSKSSSMHPNKSFTSSTDLLNSETNEFYSFPLKPKNFLRKNTHSASLNSVLAQWRILQDKERNLESMREMSASRASLSMLDISSRDTEGRHTSESSGSDHHKANMFKSMESLDQVMTNGDVMPNNLFDDEVSKGFFCDVLSHMANLGLNPPSAGEGGSVGAADDVYCTSRDVYDGAREDIATEGLAADVSTLLSEARPSPMELSNSKDLVDSLTKFLQQRLPLRVSEVLEFGSYGSGTLTRSRLDVDLVVFSPDVPRDNQEKWMPCLLHALSRHLQNACTNPDPFHAMPKATHFAVTPYSVQFTCGAVDVDVMVSYDWSNEEAAGYDALYNLSCKQTTKAARFWYALATARLQKKFLSDQPNEIKELIRVVKHWRNCVQWKKTRYRPNSYLLSLLVVKAVEETKSFDIRTVLEKIGKYILSPETVMAWNKYYLPEKFMVDFEPPTPLIRDPATPGYNVAEALVYWGQLRSHYAKWLRTLNMRVQWPAA